MSKLSDFLDSNGIDPRRILVASKKIERLLNEDRAILAAQRRVGKGRASDAEKETAKGKRRSGRPVSPALLHDAIAGKPVTAGGRKRITRALNHVLEQKKKGTQVTSSDLF